MYCVLIHAVFFPPYIEFSHIYCASLHVLFFLYILCAASCLTLGFMYCVLLHVLRLTPCIARCVVSRLMLDPHACVLCHGLCLTPCLYAMSCLVLVSMPLCCVVSRLVLAPMPCVPFHISHFSSCMPRASQVSFWTYICFFKLYIQNFFGLRIDIHIFLFFWI